MGKKTRNLATLVLAGALAGLQGCSKLEEKEGASPSLESSKSNISHYTKHIRVPKQAPLLELGKIETEVYLLDVIPEEEDKTRYEVAVALTLPPGKTFGQYQNMIRKDQAQINGVYVTPEFYEVLQGENGSGFLKALRAQIPNRHLTNLIVREFNDTPITEAFLDGSTFFPWFAYNGSLLYIPNEE